MRFWLTILGALQAAPVLAQDVLIRKITNDDPRSVACRDATSLPVGAADVNNFPQGEVMIDVSPTGILAATAKDYRYGPTGSTIYNDRVWSGLYWSDDRGEGWRNRLFQNRTPYRGLPASTSGAYGLPGGAAVTITHESDPVVAFDGSGNLYSCALAFQPDAPEPDIFGMPAGFVVSRRDERGELVDGTTHFIALETDGAVFGDKNWIAVDRESAPEDAVVVVTWRVFVSGGSTVPEGAYVAVSGDGARTFSAPIRVPLPSAEQNGSLTYQPIVGRDRASERRALFIIFRLNSRDGFETRMHVVKADIEGVSGTEALASHLRLPATWTHFPDRLTGIQRFGSHGYDGSFRFGSYFMPALDTSTGTLYAVTHSFDSNHRGSRVLISRSTDGGAQWSPPRAIDNPPVGNQVMPTVAAANGVVSVLWYDSRHDPTFAPLQIMQGIDVYYGELDSALELRRVLRLTPSTQPASHPVFTRSRPGSASLNSLVQQEGYLLAPGDDRPSASRGQRLAPEPYGFIGDYIGIAADDEAAYAVWTDLRDLDTGVDIRAGSACDGRRNQNIYFARIGKAP